MRKMILAIAIFILKLLFKEELGHIGALKLVLASIFAAFMWGDEFSVTFFIGALLVLSANIPNTLFVKRFKLSPVFLLIFSLLIPINSFATSKKIILLEIIPADSSDYTISSEKKQIEVAADLALERFKSSRKCDIGFEKILEMGTEERLISKVNDIKIKFNNKIVVGLSRSNFARVAAKVAVGTEIKAISIGASASNLGEINKKFMTMVNPWEEQFKLVKNSLASSKCAANETLGVFDPGNFLSNNFLNAFKGANLGNHILYPQKMNFSNKIKCIFIGLNFSESSEILASLESTNWQGNIVGTGDWNIHSEELNNLSKKLSSKIQISVPTGWVPESSKESVQFAILFEKRAKEIASPIAAYVYDGVLLASESLCNGVNIYGEIKTNTMMLRRYKGRNNTGNLLSNMYLKKFKGSL